MAANSEMSISCWIDAKVEEEGAISVPSEPLTEFVKSRPTGIVILTTASQTETLSVLCDRCETHIVGIYPQDYHATTNVDEDIVTAIDVGTLRQAINYVVFATALEGSRSPLRDVHAILEDNRLTLETADGFRSEDIMLLISISDGQLTSSSS
jgi:DNA polymerase-3 subunit beta